MVCVEVHTGPQGVSLQTTRHLSSFHSAISKLGCSQPHPIAQAANLQASTLFSLMLWLLLLIWFLITICSLLKYNLFPFKNTYKKEKRTNIEPVGLLFYQMKQFSVCKEWGPKNDNS